MADLDSRSVSSDDINPTPPNRLSDSGRLAGTLIAGAVIGATLSYLFDPAGGARRRAVLRDKTVSLLRSAARDIGARAHDAQHRAQGVLAEGRNRLGDHAVEDDQLAARVRAALGHHIDRVRPIEVAAEDGRVVLRGQVPEGEIEAAVAAARTVRGVAEVDNQLEAARMTSPTARGDEIVTP